MPSDTDIAQVTPEEIVTLIRETGFTPAQRTTSYDILGPAS